MIKVFGNTTKGDFKGLLLQLNHSSSNRLRALRRTCYEQLGKAVVHFGLEFDIEIIGGRVHGAISKQDHVHRKEEVHPRQN